MDNKPIFIKLEEYKDIKDVLSLIKGKVNEAKKVLSEIDNLKKQEEQEIMQWHTEIDDIEQRIHMVDSILLNE